DEDGPGPASRTLLFNEDASATPSYIGYRYTAVSDGGGGALPLTITVQPQTGAGTYHFYGLSNEVASPAAATLTVGDATDRTFSGTISGVGHLVKQGSGTFTLAGDNTYRRTTTVQAGTLALGNSGTNNNIAASTHIHLADNTMLDVTGLDTGSATDTLILAAGQTLSGTGTVLGNLIAAGGSTVAPGASPGILHQNGDLTLDAGSTYAFELNGPYATAGVDYDQIDVTGGTVTLNSPTLNLIGGVDAATPGQVLTIINNDGSDPVSGTFDGYAEGATVTLGGFSAVISYVGGDGNDVTLNVPGPAEYTETGGGADFELRLIENGDVDTLQLLRNGVVVDARPFNAVTRYTLNGQDDVTDTLLINYTPGGTPERVGFFPLPVTFHGGLAGNDVLTIAGGSFHTDTYNYTNATDGNVRLDPDGPGGVAATVITYTGLDPLINTGTAIHATFNLPVGADAATLSDLGGGTLRLAGATFEQTDFTLPTGSLTINGGGDDLLTVPAALTLGAADLTVTLGSIQLNGGSISTADQTYQGAVILGADTTLTGNDVTFAATVDADGTARALQVTTDGTTRFAGNVGAASPLSALTTDAAGTTVFTSQPLTSATLDYDAAWDTNGDAYWDSSRNANDPRRWAFLENLMPVAVSDGTFVEVAQVLAFPVGGNGATMTDFEDTNLFTGNPTDEDASFELVLRPSDLSGNHVLFETGGNGTGMSLRLLAINSCSASRTDSAATTRTARTTIWPRSLRRCRRPGSFTTWWPRSPWTARRPGWPCS
ncbi:MAG TPA: autotransporter-associated beta strand repeat-containing protein, partial [Candidatus Anammoximicrobium sp.]|nr:autotransporter-associated beta strand repeat-containing protein [Candidatus Anammoximicrobium sp.]